MARLDSKKLFVEKIRKAYVNVAAKEVGIESLAIINDSRQQNREQEAKEVSRSPSAVPQDEDTNSDR